VGGTALGGAIVGAAAWAAMVACMAVIVAASWLASSSEVWPVRLQARMEKRIRMTGMMDRECRYD
jgi:hypothetical protein